jgi:uroporphyrin-III C-methyltransferase
MPKAVPSFAEAGSVKTSSHRGKVWLVGAGPGDPELLTVKAVNRLRCADVVLHDALVPREVLALAPSLARIVNVGKRCGQKHITQREINNLLVTLAKDGNNVVRLKSGDPFVFGRGGEEVDALQRADVEVEVVPGITAAIAAAAAAKVALTDRRCAQQLLLVSAHHAPEKTFSSQWEGLTSSNTTIVVYMPGQAEQVATKLLQAGMEEKTPCLMISRISQADEQRFQTTLADLSQAPLLPPPVLLIAGATIRF